MPLDHMLLYKLLAICKSQMQANQSLMTVDLIEIYVFSIIF